MQQIHTYAVLRSPARYIGYLLSSKAAEALITEHTPPLFCLSSPRTCSTKLAPRIVQTKCGEISGTVVALHTAQEHAVLYPQYTIVAHEHNRICTGTPAHLSTSAAQLDATAPTGSGTVAGSNMEVWRRTSRPREATCTSHSLRTLLAPEFPTHLCAVLPWRSEACSGANCPGVHYWCPSLALGST